MKLPLPLAIKDPNGKWVKEVHISPMRLKETNILSDRTMAPGGSGKPLVSYSDRMSLILSRCTDAIGDVERPKPRKEAPNFFLENWKKAFINDRNYVMAMLRTISTIDGTVYKFPTQCPHCGKNLDASIDLKNCKVGNAPIEQVMASPYKVDFPDGSSATWRLLTGEDEELLEEIQQERKADLPTALLFARVIQVNGEKPHFDDLEDWPAIWGEMISRDVREKEVSIDSKVELTCSVVTCGKQFVKKWSPGFDFFFPSGVG